MQPPARILLAEDNLADANLIAEVLRDNGLHHTLEVISDGEEALRLAGAAGNDGGGPCPDLLVLDLHLPKVDGPEILRRFRANAHCADTPVIVLSSQLSPDEREIVAGFKGVSFVAKPATLADAVRIGEMIRGVLEGV